MLMNGNGLFAPLWVGAGIMVIASIGSHIYSMYTHHVTFSYKRWHSYILFFIPLVIEPGDKRLEPTHDKLTLSDDDDGEVIQRPDTIPKKTLYNIVGEFSLSIFY